MSESRRDFSTTEPLPFITIDGEPYNLKTRTATVDALIMRDIAEEYEKLCDKRGVKRTEKDVERIIELLDIMTDKTLDAPKEIIGKLDDLQRGQIMEIVTEEIQKRRGPTRAGIAESQDSIDSTDRQTG